jgi:hypothetical protein
MKVSGGFLEKPSEWICPACGRSKSQIVAPGRNVNVICCIYRHHDHIADLIGEIVTGYVPWVARDVQGWRERSDLVEELERRFCRFSPVDICQACNNADAAAKKIVDAPRWFSFSPHGIRNLIKPAHPYTVAHEIDRYRLSVIWDKVSIEIDGLPSRISAAVQESVQKRSA